MAFRIAAASYWARTNSRVVLDHLSFVILQLMPHHHNFLDYLFIALHAFVDTGIAIRVVPELAWEILMNRGIAHGTHQHFHFQKFW